MMKSEKVSLNYIKKKKKDFYSKRTWIEFQVKHTPFRETAKGGKIKESG